MTSVCSICLCDNIPVWKCDKNYCDSGFGSFKRTSICIECINDFVNHLWYNLYNIKCIGRCGSVMKYDDNIIFQDLIKARIEFLNKDVTYKVTKKSFWNRFHKIGTVKCTNCFHRLKRVGGCPHLTCVCGHSMCAHCGKDWVSNTNHVHATYAFTGKNRCNCVKCIAVCTLLVAGMMTVILPITVYVGFVIRAKIKGTN